MRETEAQSSPHLTAAGLRRAPAAPLRGERVLLLGHVLQPRPLHKRRSGLSHHPCGVPGRQQLTMSWQKYCRWRGLGCHRVFRSCYFGAKPVFVPFSAAHRSATRETKAVPLRSSRAAPAEQSDEARRGGRSVRPWNLNAVKTSCRQQEVRRVQLRHTTQCCRK